MTPMFCPLPRPNGEDLGHSFGPMAVMPSTVARLRHFATVVGFIPSYWLNFASKTCDRFIAGLQANVVVALP